MSNYETLRSWYLAKLRKSAIEAQVSGQLTPSALIAADREVIEKLIAERGDFEEAQEEKSKALPYAIAIWVYLIFSLTISLFLFCYLDFGILAGAFISAINPANLFASGQSVPHPIVVLSTQLVFFVYPVFVFPFILMNQKSSR
ncbi:MAG: hypothetical protein K2X27_06935 [Candidatus Obscuribacterales bacterium]|nr:hypothetical protein [Candidatus Obscuribacterales bacterium]